MKNKWLFALLTFIAILVGSCKTPVETTSLSEKLFVFEKTACFGSCPIYTLTFYTNGIVEMNGKRFVDKLGIHELALTKSEYKSVVESLEDLDFCNLQSVYGEGVADLPSTVITYHCHGESKTVKAVMNYPESILLFTMNIEGLTKRPNWVSKGPNETSY